MVNTERTALDIHRDALVADLHSDTAMRMLEGVAIGQRNDTGHMDIPRLRDGGINLQVFACYVPAGLPPQKSKDKAESMIDAIEREVAANHDTIAICRTASEAESIIDSGKIAAFIGIENGEAIMSNLDILLHFYDRGVRYMTLTHTKSTDWCISSADNAPAFHGLTDFGRDVVCTMNDLGMLVDVSHIAVSAFEEVIKATKQPIIASHSCVHAICDHNRNLTDEQLRTLADSGGMVGINFLPIFLSQNYKQAALTRVAEHQHELDAIKEKYADDFDAQENALWAQVGKILRPLSMAEVTVGTIVDHIDYIAKLIGTDYVGLGSDFDGVTVLPTGMEDCTKVPAITEELVRRGYVEADIRKILGGNFMRVFRQVCGD